MSRLILAAFLCVSIFATVALGQQQPSDGPLTNASVVRLVKAGFKEKTIITIIGNRPSDFKLDTEHLIELKRSGVNENIILAMLSSQMGIVLVDDDEWTSESLLKEPKAQGGASVFGSGSSSQSSGRSNGAPVGNQNDGNVSGSATVRIIKPPTEAGGAAKLERTPTLTNDSVVELVEAGFSEGTIVRRIEQSPVEFDLSPAKLTELRKRRVGEPVINAMRAAMGEDAKEPAHPEK
jgi:hypothetical protein